MFIVMGAKWYFAFKNRLSEWESKILRGVLVGLFGLAFVLPPSAGSAKEDYSIEYRRYRLELEPRHY